MKLTPAIRKALRMYMENHGLSGRALSDILGVSSATVPRWLAEDGAQEIRAQHWAQLRPMILPYLPEQYKEAARLEAMAMNIRKELENFDGGAAVVAERPADYALNAVPLIGAVQAAAWIPAVKTAEEVAEGKTHSVAGEVPPDSVAILNDDPAIRSFPQGSILLLNRSKVPSEGRVVLCRLADRMSCLARKFCRTEDGRIRLTPIEGDSPVITIDLEKSPGGIIWIFPVERVEINLNRPPSEAN